MPMWRIAVLTQFIVLDVLVANPTVAFAQPLAIYDTFDGPMLDARWSSYEYTIPSIEGGAWNPRPPGSIPNSRSIFGGGANGVFNAEVRRGIANGALQLALGTWNINTNPEPEDSVGWGRMGVKVGHALGRIRALQVKATPRRFEKMTPCGAPVGTATLVGVVFNDGTSSSASDFVGDMIVALRVSTTGEITRIKGDLSRCADTACRWIEPYGLGAFRLTGRLGDAHVLTIRWDESRRRVIFRAMVNGESEAVVVPYSSPAEPARQFHYGLRVETRPGIACFGPHPRPRHGMYFETRFDNFKLATSAD